MSQYKVYYEVNDTWVLAGFVEAEDGGQAIERMQKARAEEISAVTGYSVKEVMEEMNFDFEKI